MYDCKLRLRKSSISNSEIYNVKVGITMQDSSSVSFTTFRDIEGTSIEAWNSVIYGNEFYDLMSVDNQGKRAINYTVVILSEIILLEISKEEMLQFLCGTIIILLVRILLGAILGDHGLVGLWNPEGENTIRNNKFGGFTSIM